MVLKTGASGSLAEYPDCVWVALDIDGEPGGSEEAARLKNLKRSVADRARRKGGAVAVAVDTEEL